MAQFRNEAMTHAARPGVRFRVDIGHVDAETFAESVAYNERVRGMAGAAVRNDDGELLLVDHEDYGGWVLPGGVVESDESFAAAAMRETAEESDVDARPVRPLLVIHFVPRYDGRSTDNFFVLFEGQAVDPDLGTDLGLDDEEITDAAWRRSLPAGIADDRTVRKTLAHVVARFETVDAGAADLSDRGTPPFEG